MISQDTLSTALRYAAAGIAVFPVRMAVRGDGKKDVHPIAEWKAASSTDPEVIRGWYGEGGRWRDAALCIDCGKSGIVGIDQDISDGKNGLVEWEKLSPPATWRVRSGSGGAHDYYRADPDRPVTVDNTGTVADGVDVRGNGGFLIAPPSIDPRGGAWEWIDGEPDWAALPPVPPVVLDRMEAAAGRKRARVERPARPEHLPTPAPAPSMRREPSSSLFGGEEGAPVDYGPEGGYKTREAASALLAAEHAAFTALTAEGSGRSHILSQRFAVLAGHGVDVFWSWDQALDILIAACEENGFSQAHGERYAIEQATRGLEYGMRERWIERVEPASPNEADVDPVDALLAEMLTLDELALLPPPKFVIQGLLQFDSESWIIGAPGSKKSFVAFDMAARIARGEPWQGRRTNPADVVMIVAEGAGGAGKRGQAWQKTYGQVQGVYILPRPVQVTQLGSWDVLVRACARLADDARERGRGLVVIIDTQARVTSGLDENSAKEMGVYVSAVSAIRMATGACVLTVHHTGRAGGDARGSSAIDGAQTTELKIESASGQLNGRLVTEKQKDMEPAAPIALTFTSVFLGLDADGEPITSLVLTEPGAWEPAEADASDATTASQAVFNDRVTWEPWIMARRPERGPQPTNVWWIVQALVDTAESLGLTQAEVKAIVTEKLGKIDKSSFARAWQTVTATDGIWTDVVIPGDGGQRWTVDRMAVSEAQNLVP